MGTHHLKWEQRGADRDLTCTCPQPIVCSHRDKVRADRRQEVREELRSQNHSLTRTLQLLRIRTRAGEYLGQDIGDIIRIGFVQELTDASVKEIEQAVHEIDAYIVADVILFR